MVSKWAVRQWLPLESGWRLIVLAGVCGVFTGLCGLWGAARHDLRLQSQELNGVYQTAREQELRIGALERENRLLREDLAHLRRDTSAELHALEARADSEARAVSEAFSARAVRP